LQGKVRSREEKKREKRLDVRVKSTRRKYEELDAR
jgi:hypothetical protein